MKKRILAVVLFFAIVGFSLPVMALDVDFSGEFYVEGILNSAEGMLKSDKTSDYRQMRLRVKTDFMVTDKLSLTTRFDALEKVLSSNDSAFDSDSDGARFDEDVDDDNIDFDRAYISYISPIGLFQVGRMQGVTWGTTFCDDETDTDRIKYVLPIPMGDGKLYIGAVAEKVTENDRGTEYSDLDNDKYYIGATYKTANYSTGLLTAFYNFKQFQDPGQSFATDDFADAYGILSAGGGLADLSSDQISAYMVYSERGLTTDAQVFLLAPYFKGVFGDWAFEAELDYIFGNASYDVSTAKDRDIQAFAYFAEASYDYGPFTFQGGFAHSKGDADYTDGDIGSMGYVSPGIDWAKLFILNADDHGMNTTLGNGVGNHVGNGFATASTAMCDGYQMLYAGADYAVTDALTLGIIGAISKADEVPDGAGYDDDQGMEVDVSLTWNITDNLAYTAIGAYLDGGDYWSTRASGGVDDPSIDPDIYTLYHKLTLIF
ncbi:MAG: hypothetical protein QM498_13495 [Desulfobacterium sp.]